LRITESKNLVAQPPADYFFESDESTAADEKNFFRVDLDIFLMRVFASTLRWNIAATTLQDLEERLLDTFTGNIPGDTDVIGFSPDFVDFVNINDANLGTFHVVVSILQQTQNNVLNIFTDIP